MFRGWPVWDPKDEATSEAKYPEKSGTGAQTQQTIMNKAANADIDVIFQIRFVITFI